MGLRGGAEARSTGAWSRAACGTSRDGCRACRDTRRARRSLRCRRSPRHLGGVDRLDLEPGLPDDSAAGARRLSDRSVPMALHARVPADEVHDLRRRRSPVGRPVDSRARNARGHGAGCSRRRSRARRQAASSISPAVRPPCGTAGSWAPERTDRPTTSTPSSARLAAIALRRAGAGRCRSPPFPRPSAPGRRAWRPRRGRRGPAWRSARGWASGPSIHAQYNPLAMLTRRISEVPPPINVKRTSRKIALDRVLGRVSVAGRDPRRASQTRSRPPRRRASPSRVLRVVWPLDRSARRPTRSASRRLQIDRHLGQVRLDGLELADGPPELLPLVRVARASSNAARATPSASAAVIRRISARISRRQASPCPGFPRMLVAGVSSKATSEVGEARTPSCRCRGPPRGPGAPAPPGRN